MAVRLDLIYLSRKGREYAKPYPCDFPHEAAARAAFTRLKADYERLHMPIPLRGEVRPLGYGITPHFKAANWREILG